MNKTLKNQGKIAKFQKDFAGVFTFSDLKNLIAHSDRIDLYRQIKSLEENDVLLPFTRGIYVCPDFDLATVSQRLCAKSYVSLANVLAADSVIGTVPKNTVYAVKLGRPRIYKSPRGTVIHLSIAPRLFFGFKNRDGVNYADREKAFLDTLYFYQKGLKLYFNVYQDLNAELLDAGKIKKYLKAYKNPRFIEFVKGLLHG